MKKKQSRIAPIVVGILLVLLGVGFFIRYGVSSRASDQRPENVKTTLESPTTEVIEWTTGTSTQGQVLYAPDSKGPWDKAAIVPEEAPAVAHRVVITNIPKTSSVWYFRIQIAETIYDNVDGLPWSFSTDAGSQVVPTTPVQAITAGVQPTHAPVAPSVRPSPIQVIEVPNSGSSQPAPTVPAVCSYDTCADIPPKFGHGCSTQDYIVCLHSVTPTP